MRVLVLGGTGSIRGPVVRELIRAGHEVAAELGEWARGYALHQWQSGGKARRQLGWRPLHLDPESEILAIP